MATYIVLARKRWGEKCTPLTQVSGSETKAINIAHDIYIKGGMNRALVIDAQFNVIFKLDRRCKCTNAQYQINGLLVCEDCKRVIPNNGFKVKEYQ